jgi:hypothetical protein
VFRKPVPIGIVSSIERKFASVSWPGSKLNGLEMMAPPGFSDETIIHSSGARLTTPASVNRP